MVNGAILHPRPDPSAQDLIEKVDVDRAELRLQIGRHSARGLSR